MVGCTFRMNQHLGMESQDVWSTHGYIYDTIAVGMLDDRYGLTSNGQVNLSVWVFHASLIVDTLLRALSCDLKLMIYVYSHMSLYIYLLHSFCPQLPSLSPSRPLTNQDFCHCQTLCVILPRATFFFQHKVGNWLHYLNPPIGWISLHHWLRTTPMWGWISSPFSVCTHTLMWLISESSLPFCLLYHLRIRDPHMAIGVNWRRGAGTRVNNNMVVWATLATSSRLLMPSHPTGD